MNLASPYQPSPPLASYSPLRNISASTAGGNSTTSHTLNNSRAPTSSSSHSSVYTSTHGGIRKKPVASSIGHRSASNNHLERLQQVALGQSADNEPRSPQVSASLNWLTPQHSPEPSAFIQEPAVTAAAQFQSQNYSTWSAPTPPRSDSGLPTVSADTAEEQPAICAGVSSPGSFAFEQGTASPEMSSLGFLLPSQYANGMYPSDANSGYNMDPNYTQPLRSQPVTSGQPSYTSTVSSSSPSLYQSRPTADGRREVPPPAAYGSRRIAGPYDSPVSSDYSMQASQSIPSISGLAPSPMTASSAMSPAQYNSSMPRPQQNMYESQYYAHAYTQPQATPQMYATQNSAYPASPYLANDSMKQMPGDPAMRAAAAANQRPKPQCWEHGCNGRQFSTFSNLLRHQREKSGTAAKSYCPKCGAEFTRTTARNGHVAHDKCTKTSTGRPADDKQ